jgi:hypothetical protein
VSLSSVTTISRRIEEAVGQYVIQGLIQSSVSLWEAHVSLPLKRDVIW